MIKIELNGVEQELDVPGQMPVLWVLRDILDLKGSKFACGQGMCGSCTIWVDGESRRSCQLPLENVAGKKLTTIEGLADWYKDKNGSGKVLHPVQQAWMDHNVPQCGFCQAGQIMSAAALLEQKAQPSRTEINQALQGNLCRCGTYKRIVKAMLSFGGGGK